MKKIFTILSVCALTFASAQTNLISNPGFETWTDGKPDGWWSGGITYTQSTNPVHGGTYAAGVTSPNSSNKTINPTPDITIDGTKTYVFSGWYLDNTPNARFKYWNQWRSATADTGSNSLQAADYSTDSPEWKFFTAEGVPNAGATVARPGLRVYPENNVGGDIIYFDDIMFYDKATLAVTDVKEFDKQVKMNTIVDNELTLRLPERSTVNIYSIDGKLVSSNRVSDGDSINTTGLQKGNYIVTVDNGSAKISRKVIKK